MKLPKKYTLKEISEILDCSFSGPEDHEITGINEIHMVENGDIVFVDHPKYYEKALQSRATTILINKEVERPEGKGLIFSEDPFKSFNKLALIFSPFQKLNDKKGEDVVIGAGTIISPNVTLGNHVKIGSNCIIHPGVVLYDKTEIGNNVVIHANTIIGGDAFYYKKRESYYDKLYSTGKVIIEDNVEIGTACTIDRGVSGETVIGWGTKIDNQVHVGHDTVIGKNCLFAAQVGIAGCVVIEDDVTLWGQVGIRSDIRLSKGTVVMAQSGVSKDLIGGKAYFGSPASEYRDKLKEMASLRKIPFILEQLKRTKEE